MLASLASEAGQNGRVWDYTCLEVEQGKWVWVVMDYRRHNKLAGFFMICKSLCKCPPIFSFDESNDTSMQTLSRTGGEREQWNKV